MYEIKGRNAEALTRCPWSYASKFLSATANQGSEKVSGRFLEGSEMSSGKVPWRFSHRKFLVKEGSKRGFEWVLRILRRLIGEERCEKVPKSAAWVRSTKEQIAQ